MAMSVTHCDQILTIIANIYYVQPETVLCFTWIILFNPHNYMMLYIL